MQVLQDLNMEDELDLYSKIFKCVEHLSVLVMHRRWTEVDYNLALISEAFSKPENR
jgi:hypothetical protein